MQKLHDGHIAETATDNIDIGKDSRKESVCENTHAHAHEEQTDSTKPKQPTMDGERESSAKEKDPYPLETEDSYFCYGQWKRKGEVDERVWRRVVSEQQHIKDHFQEWVERHFPNYLLFHSNLTYGEYYMFLRKFGRDTLRDAMLDLNGKMGVEGRYHSVADGIRAFARQAIA